MKTKALLAVEIGGTKLQLIAADEAGAILRRERRDVVRVEGAQGILRQIAEVITVWYPDFAWKAVGVGFGGPVERGTGRIAASCHIEGWDGFPLGDWLRNLTGAPVAVENDANAAAYGEATLGAGRGADPVFYTNSGSGVGGGLVVDGMIYHGAPPGEAEFGHLRLDRNGTTVEHCCSGWALDRAVRAAVEKGGTLLAEMVGEPHGGEAKMLLPAILKGDAAAAAILAEATENLAYALSHVVHLFHPQAIVLGGGVSQIGERWRKSVEDALPKYLMPPFQPGPEIRLTTLGEDAVPVGAIACALGLLKG
jgi:glucokinase